MGGVQNDHCKIIAQRTGGFSFLLYDGTLPTFIYVTGWFSQIISRLYHRLMWIHHLMLFLFLSCSDVLFVNEIPVGKHAHMVYLLSQPTIQWSRYVQSVCACVCSVWKIRPQKMLIRVDLGTWSCCLMDRVQGQTSPWGAMILSLIVHTHLPSPLTLHPLNTRIRTHKHTCSLTLPCSTRITGRINLFLTIREKEDGSRRQRKAWGSKGESSAWRGDGRGDHRTRGKKHRGMRENQQLAEVSLPI